MSVQYSQHLEDHILVAKQTMSHCLDAYQKILAALETCFQTQSKVIFCGNGGSAADAQHLAAEFIVRFKKDGKALPAISLSTDTSILTAAGNDLGYEHIFSRQIEALGHKGDILIALSTSGMSPNILKALEQAQAQNMITILLTGENGGKAKEKADIVLCVPSNDTAHIQEMHITIGHSLCKACEAMR